MSKKTPTIIIQEKPEGIKVKIDGCASPDHAIYMLAQAQCIIVINNDDVTIESTEGESDAVQELSTTDATQEPDMQ